MQRNSEAIASVNSVKTVNWVTYVDDVWSNLPNKRSEVSAIKNPKLVLDFQIMPHLALDA